MRPAALSLAALGSLCLASPGWATLVETDANSGSGGTQSTYDAQISSTDLINAGQPTLSSVAATATPTFPLSGLNNGSATTDTTTLTYWGNPPASVDVTFTLNTSTNTRGYDLTGVTKFNGWGDSTSRYGNQKFNVLISTVDTPTTFNLLKSVTYTPFATSDVASGASKVTLTDTTGILATRVAAIQFHFVPIPGTTAEIGVFREINVAGSATPVPELGALGLLGVAGLLAVRRRRTR